MSVITNNLLLGDEGYFLTKSLRFRRSASAYLSRTFGTPTNGTTWTISYWAKLGILGRCNHFAPNLSTNEGSISIESDYKLYVNARVGTVGGAGTNYFVTTNQVFRDPSAYYHIVVALDTTQATDTNRTKVYVNGTQVTFSSASYPPQNSTPIMGSAVAHAIGRVGESGYEYYYDGLFGEMNFIDGQALTPSSFGETDSKTGVWIPKKYTGTYGTNGFYLPFTDVATTSGSNAGLGKDFSGNGNYWTTNNISVTSGSTYDSMKDVPTLTSSDTANYCTWNPAFYRSNESIADGGLSCTTGTAGGTIGTIAVSTGKWYWETINPTTTSTARVAGLINHSLYANDLYAKSIYVQVNGRYTINNGADVIYGSTAALNDIVGVALDVDAQTVIFYLNGVAQGSAISLTSVYSAGEFVVPAIAQSGGASRTFVVNFGQRPFAYSPPTGYKPLNTANLSTPTIGATASTQANKYMDILTWTGTSTASARTFTGLNFQPDFVWSKLRSVSGSHQLYDAVRGTAKRISSNLTDAETTNPANGYISAFNSDGFATTAGSTDNGWWNELNSTYVAWNWKANGSGSSNTDGSITSTVSANTTAGFSIVTYTGNGTAGATVGHGLGVAPKMIIVKSRSNSATNWVVYHESAGNNGFLLLNSTNAFSVASTSWNNTSPTSTVFTLGNGTSSNANGSNQVGYCFSEVAGYSKFGSYTGNGNANGAFIFTGFRPKYILWKRTNAIEQWTVWTPLANGNGIASSNNFYLLPNSSAAQDTTQIVDTLSNGFKHRDSGSLGNANGGTYIYMAFAENPFKFSNAR